MTKYQTDLDRIVSALEAGGEIYRSRSIGTVRVDKKTGGAPVTDVEREVNELLFRMLVQNGEGWLSEESTDSEERLRCSRIWLVDPLDGTAEYLTQIPEWCISIALMEEDQLVAGGIYNPLTEELFYGSCETGVLCRNGSAPRFVADTELPSEPLVLASRNEVQRGEWGRFCRESFRIRPMGSVAYKLALVAAGKADATWTLVPKHEWDVAGGVALLLAAQGHVLTSEGVPPSFNNRNPLFPGLIGFSATGIERLRPFLELVSTGAGFRDCLPWARAFASSSSNS